MAAEDPPDGYLFDLYRRYVGEPDDHTDIYVGFGLFVGGIGLAVMALVLFVWGATLEYRSPDYFTVLRPAYAIGMLSLPTFMLGIVVLLPSERRMRILSAVGTGATVLAALWFVVAYPGDWLHGADYTAGIIGIYAIGLAGVTAATGASLIGHYLDTATADSEPEEEAEEDEGPAYTDAEIEADIDDAMEGVELSWGGVPKSENKRLTFSDTEFDGSSLDSNLATKTTRSSGVDAQVAGLKGLKGGDTKMARSESTVDDQTQKLKELREKQRAEELATADEDESAVGGALSGLLERLRAVVRRD